MVAAIPVLFMGPTLNLSGFLGGPASRAEFEVGRQFVKDNGPRSVWMFIAARWACIPFSLLGAWVCYCWARALYGAWAGVLASTLWCICPNLLGHGQLITPDVPGAAMCVAATFVFWRWLRRPTWWASVCAGSVLGLAQLTKTTAVALYVVWPLLYLLDRAFLAGRARDFWKHGGQLVGMLALGAYILNLGYAFEGTGQPLGTYHFVSRKLTGGNNQPASTHLGNRFANGPVASLPVLLPANYVLGIDAQLKDFEDARISYLRGEFRQRGWWYYYLYALLIKLPLGTWLVGLTALGAALFLPEARAHWRDELVCLLPGIAFFLLVSSQTGFSHHLRYVFPAIPFFFVASARAANLVRWREPSGALVLVGVLAAVVSSLRVYPHSVSYFNELVGGPRRGPEHLLDSNIDWGQDLYFLQQWRQRHPEAEPLRVVYFGLFDPRHIGMPYEEETSPRPGWCAASVNALHGYRLGGKWDLRYTYFQRFKPVAMAGYSIYIYHITLEDANRVRREVGLPELTPEDVARLQQQGH
jgi:hypothetical protein